MIRTTSDRLNDFFSVLRAIGREKENKSKVIEELPENRFTPKVHDIVLEILPALGIEAEAECARVVVMKIRGSGWPIEKAQVIEALFHACNQPVVLAALRLVASEMHDDCRAASLIAVMKVMGPPDISWMSRYRDPTDMTREQDERSIWSILELLSFGGSPGRYWKDSGDETAQAIERAVYTYVRDGRRNVSADARITRFKPVPQSKERLNALRALLENAPRVLNNNEVLSGPGRVFYEKLIEQVAKRQPIDQRLRTFAPITQRLVEGSS